MLYIMLTMCFPSNQNPDLLYLDLLQALKEHSALWRRSHSQLSIVLLSMTSAITCTQKGRCQPTLSVKSEPTVVLDEVSIVGILGIH